MKLDKNIAIETNIMIALFNAVVEQTNFLTNEYKREPKRAFKQWQSLGFRLQEKLLSHYDEKDEEFLEAMTEGIENVIHEYRKYLELIKKYLDKIRKLESDVFYNIGKASQKTIDLVQETLEGLDRDHSEDPIMRDELGALNYDIENLIEVWNKELEYDIKCLQELNLIIKT